MAPTVVLGLSINTRMLGLAVISGNRLIDHHIQLRKDAWTPQKRELILASLQPWLDRYTIKNVALSISHEKQTSSQTKELLESITSCFSQQEISLSTYPAKTFYTICSEAKKKREVMRVLAEMYPELSFYYKKEIGNKNKYYVKLFEAVAIATIHSQVLKEEKEN